jgi:carboxyl-terminal processing protease
MLGTLPGFGLSIRHKKIYFRITVGAADTACVSARLFVRFTLKQNNICFSSATDGIFSFRFGVETMRKSVFTAFLLLIGLFFQTPAQNNKKSITQLPTAAVEPFKIEKGSTFSASVPRPNQNQPSSKPRESARSIVAQDYEKALALIRSYHVDGKTLDSSELIKSAMTSMLHSLDPHSNFYDPTEYREFLNDEQSEYIGIGASIANFTKNGVTETYVVSTFPDSPATRSGLRFGDKIISVNGEKMTGKTSFYVRGKIRGIKGSVARLTVERAHSGRIEIIEIRRSSVPQPSIPDAYLLRPGVGYIDLSNGFTFTTGVELETALKGLKEQGMNSLILDLRDNPGGILEQAVKVAEKFLPAGQTIVTQRGRFAIDSRDWKSKNNSPENIPLVVLVNRASASASEIVAGALQDYDRALIVGEKTFGKGLVQSVINLPHNAGLTLTTARYYTPSGRSIQRKYEQVNLYDYYQNKISFEETEKRGAASKTVTGRNVYGGDGIMPDEIVKEPIPDSLQIKLLDSIFFFAAEVAGGRISGLENYKITRPVQFGQRVRPADFPASEELFSAFKNYLTKTDSGFTSGQIEANRKYILLRLRFNLATAAFGSVAAKQVLVETDAQVGKAIETLPRAQILALNARKVVLKK